MALTKVTSGLISADASSVDLNIDAGTLYIDATNNRVGIGTSSPGNPLVVRTGTNENFAIQTKSGAIGITAYNDAVTSNIDLHLQATQIIFDNGATEAMRITSGLVGIGTASPSDELDISSVSPAIRLTDTSTSGLYHTIVSATNDLLISADAGNVEANTEIEFAIDGTERMRIDSSGNVGIGTSSPASGVGVPLTLTSTSTGYVGLRLNGTGSYTNDWDLYASGDGAGLDYFGIYDRTNLAYRMVVTNTGNVGIGTSNPVNKLQVESSSGNVYLQIKRASQSQGQTALELAGGTSGVNWVMYQPTSSNTLTWFASGGVQMSLTTAGALTIAGALSKGSGSFRIDHPLESKKDTHQLVHSFIEGPQADLIYRGKVDLVDGSATVNIDAVAGMTEGTFVALNREVQCFTSNESDWDAVKGSVLGNILTIECQNTSSTATVSWLVIGERQDQHMYDTDWTDDNGKVIVEPLKGE